MSIGFVKNQFNIGSLLIVFIMSSLSFISKSQNSDCHSTKPIINKIEILFSDTTAYYQFMLSPFDKNKVWVSFTGNKIIEVDIHTAQINALSEEYRTVFSPVRNWSICKDNFDSIVWIGGNNCNLLKYEQRTKELVELPVRYVTKIIPQPARVYFVSFWGIYYWDRKQGKIEKELAVPLPIIQKSTLLDDDRILLDDSLTFDFKKRSSFHGIQYDGQDHITANQLLMVKSGIWVLRNGSSIKILNNVEPIIELNNSQYKNSNQFLSIDPPFVWNPFDYQHIFTYNVKTKQTRVYWYRIPEINKFALSYLLCNNFLWIYRAQQVYLISMEDGKLYNYPISQNDGFLNLHVTPCNVYLLYKDRIKVYVVNNFINFCIPFDGIAYENELLKFKHACDSLKIFEEKNQTAIIEKLMVIRSLFSSSNNYEVKGQLADLDKSAFNNINKIFPSYYDSCYKNIELPLSYRKDCLYHMIYQYTKDGNINMVIKTDLLYHQLFGDPGKIHFEYKSTKDSINKYIYVNNRIDKLKLSKDSAEYYKALSFLTICRTSWFVNEAQYFDLTLVNTKLRKFIKSFPNSKLVDNAEFTILSNQGTDGEDEVTDLDLTNIIDTYKNLLLKYPDTDLRADIQFIIITLYNEMNIKNNLLIKSECDKFIHEYPHFKNIEKVRNIFKSIN